MSGAPGPEDQPTRILLGTRFGEFEADSTSVLSFPDGLPGFEHLRRFVVLTANATAPLQCLVAVDSPDVAFLAIDPRLVEPGFTCALETPDLVRLETDGKEPMVWLAILAVDEDEVITANLHAPVVINPARMIGRQVLPRTSSYSVRQRLGVA